MISTYFHFQKNVLIFYNSSWINTREQLCHVINREPAHSRRCLQLHDWLLGLKLRETVVKTSWGHQSLIIIIEIMMMVNSRNKSNRRLERLCAQSSIGLIRWNKWKHLCSWAAGDFIFSYASVKKITWHLKPRVGYLKALNVNKHFKGSCSYVLLLPCVSWKGHKRQKIRVGPWDRLAGVGVCNV